MSDIFQVKYWEHSNGSISKEKLIGCTNAQRKTFNSKKDAYCYSYEVVGDVIKFEASYYIGIDWIVENKSSIVVAPKLNSKLIENEKVDFEPDDNITQSQINNSDIVEIDYLKMLNVCLSDNVVYENVNDLAQIDWKASQIPIEQNQDWLSPLLIVQYLNILKRIVRKGLMKSFYKVEENITNRVKGKILVSENFKRNVFKNKFTKTLCKYEVFGFDNIANRTLKKALKYSTSYIENNKLFFDSKDNYSKQLLNFCVPAFENISDDLKISELKQVRFNSLYKEYEEAIKLAKLILKRFSYTISETSSKKLSTPPYWIDMPRLFELYVYSILKKNYNKKELDYHFTAKGNELDFLLNTDESKMVIDTKYKPLYCFGISHQDVRQLSGYSRLEKVYKDLKLKDDKVIDCLIIYPDLNNGIEPKNINLKEKNYTKISQYRNFYKLGIKLPQK